MLQYKMLNRFGSLFDGEKYLHRNSSLGDKVARDFYEDLYDLERSKHYKQRIDKRLAVLSLKNKAQGIKARRGDGSFGEILPNCEPEVIKGFSVARGPIASIEIGVEVKIMMKAMEKQIDRVVGDFIKQVEQFKARNEQAICVGLFGLNRAEECTTYEKDRLFTTNGRDYRHPIQEAPGIERRVLDLVAPRFDEFLIINFKATNIEPFSFAWCNRKRIEKDYGAILVRVSQKYESLFK